VSFWENLNNELKTAAYDGFRAMRDGLTVGGLRLRIHNIQRKTAGHLASIGAVVYEMEKTPWENPLSNPEVLRLIAEIKKLEAEAEAVSDELKTTGKAGKASAG